MLSEEKVRALLKSFEMVYNIPLLPHFKEMVSTGIIVLKEVLEEGK